MPTTESGEKTRDAFSERLRAESEKVNEMSSRECLDGLMRRFGSPSALTVCLFEASKRRVAQQNLVPG